MTDTAEHPPPAPRRKTAMAVLIIAAAVAIWQLEGQQSVTVTLGIQLSDLEAKVPATDTTPMERLTRRELVRMETSIYSQDQKEVVSWSFSFAQDGSGAPPTVNNGPLSIPRGEYDLIARLYFKRHEGSPHSVARKHALHVDKEGWLPIRL